MGNDSLTMLGVRISRTPLHELITRAMRAIDNRDRVVFACANPHSLAVAVRDARFKAALNAADQVVADGAGVTLLGRLVGLGVGPRITGSDYFFSTMRALSDSGNKRVFFFGSTDKVLDMISERLRREFPSVELCGTLSPPFSDWREEEDGWMIERINAARPDVLWVGMTAPKQEKWVYANSDKLQAPVIGSIGAVFDFYAGTHPRAPQWMRRVGFEWLFRFMREPVRMWQRNLVSTPLFIKLVIQHHLLRKDS